VNDRDWLAEQFEQHRPHLRAVAYRMLGSVSDSDDAVQEAWLRLSRSDVGAVTNLGGWLTTVVGRVCLDMLRARRSRREDAAPEPIVWVDGTDPEQEALVADAVGLALLVVLETLSPAERLAFVLHDMFAIPFEEIAPVVGRSPAATRQLASRARRRVRGAAPAADPDLAQQRAVVDALVDVLDPDVVFRTDVRAPVRGSAAVARQVLARGSRFAPLARPALVNGAAGLVVVGPGRTPRAVLGFSISGGRIAALDLVLDPATLGRLDLTP